MLQVIKMSISCVRTSFELRKTLRCNCPAYQYPHNLGKGECKTSINTPPLFSAPKRGLAHKLSKLIDDLENEIETITDQNCDRISLLLKQFKKDLYAQREADNFELEHN